MAAARSINGINFFYTLLILICSLQSCRHPVREHKKGPELLQATSPDSSVNALLELRNAAKTPDSINTTYNDSTHVVVLSTSDELQFLIAYQSPGEDSGSYIGFEISRLSKDLMDYPYKKLKTEKFITQNGIFLEMSVADLIKIKGPQFEKKSDSGLDTYIWTVTPADFLKRHHASKYIFQCDVAFDKISRIRFGFMPDDYPLQYQ
jgi:hypothetical protein